MIDVFVQLFPIFALFILGYILKRIHFLEKQHADLFLKLGMYIVFPALIIPSFASLPLRFDLVYLPLIAIFIMLILFCVSFVVGKGISLSRQTYGTFLLSGMNMNLTFVLAFFLAIVGPEYIAYFLLFNFGHDVLLFTFVYSLACRYGTNNYAPKQMLKKLISLPPLWAMFIGLFLNVAGIALPVVLDSTFSLLGGLFIPLVMLALGVYFSFATDRPLLLFSGIGIRMAGGLLLAFLFVWLFSLEGISRLVVLMSGFAPVGFNTLVFSSLENLDKEFAAQAVSLALLIGLVGFPVLLYFVA